MTTQLTHAVATKKLAAVTGKLDAMPDWSEGPPRLALLRQQAALVDQRDAAADKKRLASLQLHR